MDIPLPCDTPERYYGSRPRPPRTRYTKKYGIFFTSFLSNILEFNILVPATKNLFAAVAPSSFCSEPVRLTPSSIVVKLSVTRNAGFYCIVTSVIITLHHLA